MSDSIVVAPSQTLNDIQYQMLRTASVEIIRYLKIEGGCNVQYAVRNVTIRYRSKPSCIPFTMH